MTERHWYTARGFVASAALLIFILITGIATSVLSARSSVPSTGAAPARVPDVAWGSRCGLPHGSQDPVVGPPAAQWTLVGHVAAPAIPGVGPGELAGTDRRCYQHSPLGALLAAANFLPISVAVTDHAAGIDHYVPGRLRDIFARQPAIPVAPQTTVAIIGFKEDVLGRDAVNVMLALRINGVLGYAALPMRWTTPAGDWRVLLFSVQDPIDAGRLDSTAGYIPWTA
jgi:hypothetical protein